jgi:hypothetical protein
LERFDWRAAATARRKSHKSWDAIRQLARYADVVGREIPNSIQSLQSGELFIESRRPPDRS